jgi:beta-phosphoglucomutase-like phosphatase (HAD superfamily)
MPEISFDMVGSFAALIFDCDGTLVGSNELHYRTLNEVVGSQGTGMPRAWFVARIGFSQHEILRQFEHVANVARRYWGKIPLAVALGERVKLFKRRYVPPACSTSSTRSSRLRM